MADRTGLTRTCPVCGIAVSYSAAVCPACSSVLPAEQEGNTCAFCGSPIVDGRCPVCGSEKPQENPATSARRWTYLALALAVLLLIGSAWLTRPWDALESTPEPDARAQYQNIPTATLTRTPTPTPTGTPTSTPTATATATPTPLFLSYSVVRGDTASHIAQQFGITTDALLEANDLLEDDILSLGQILRIPTSGGSPKDTATVEPTSRAATETPAGAVAPTLTATAAPTSPPATATRAPTQGLVIHTVAAGQHLGIIADLYDLTQEDIARANNIGVDDILSIGQQLVIPVPGSDISTETASSGETPDATAAARAPVEYTVQEGDLLGRIAIRYGITTEELARANSISENSVLSIGQVLVIPGTEAEPTPAPPPTATPTTASQALLDSLTGIAASTVTPRPVATAEAASRDRYPRPNLLRPISGTEYRGADASILLSWTSAGILGEDDWYQLRIWSANQTSLDETLWTKGTSWRLPASMFQPDSDGVLWWKVSVVERTPEEAEPEPQSAESQVYKLIWK